MSTTILAGEHAAMWWLPEHDDCQTAGRYIVNEDGTTRIEFYEDLQEKIAEKTGDGGTRRWALSGEEVYPLVYGSVNGMSVTAVSARLTGMKYDFPSGSRLEQRTPQYSVESRFYLLEESDLSFSRIRLSPKCLSELTSWHKDPNRRSEATDTGSTEHIVSLATQPDRKAVLRDAEVMFRQRFHMDIANNDDGVQMFKTGTIVIELSEAVSIEALDTRFILPLMYMLTLLSGQPEGVAGFEFCSDAMPYPEEKKTNGQTVRKDLWNTVRHPILMRIERGQRRHPPLSLLDLVDWQSAVERWLDWAELGAAEMQLMYLLMAVTSYPWLEARFITSAQLVEGTHRKTFPVSSKVIEDNSEMVARVTSVLKEAGGLNADIRSDIKSALKYMYEPSLEKRIVELDAATADAISGIGDVDIRVVARKCAELRNAFAHSTERRPVNDLGGVQVAYAVLYLLGLSALLAKVEHSPAAAVAKVRNWSGAKRLVNMVENHWSVLRDTPPTTANHHSPLDR